MIDGAVRCALGDKACVEKAEKDGKPVVITDAKGEVITDEDGRPVSNQEEASKRATAPGEGVWRNYDFVPGRKVLKLITFDSQPVGRFPAGLATYVRGNMQVVELENTRRLETTGNGVIRVQLPEETGESFSIEFLVRFPTLNIGVSLFPTRVEGPISRYPHHYINISGRPGLYRQGLEVSAVYMPTLVQKDLPVKIQYDSGYTIVYVGPDRVGQVPNANIPSTRELEFQLSGNPRFPTYLTDIVVAKGIDDLYAALTTSGSFTTRGIYFDTGRTDLRPESSKVLGELVDALTKASTLKVAIIGHTDSQGEDEFNKKLSEGRAQAVVDYLVKRGIDRSRLQAEGKGEAEPVSSNETAEGRQDNRRVEIKVLSKE
jgi:outer membrane protein OmpA-like peptidoglycan-associated protein